MSHLCCAECACEGAFLSDEKVKCSCDDATVTLPVTVLLKIIDDDN